MSARKVTRTIPSHNAAGKMGFDLVLIGSSTGGPRALVEVLSRLPAGFAAGVVIAQHMPAGFTRTLAERLDRICPLPVAEAHDAAPILPGRVLVAPAGGQTSIERSGARLVARVDTSPSLLFHRPSVDHLFHSAVASVGPRAIAVVLTGMGDDGARGLHALHQTGALTIVESQDTAVIYGMPRAAASTADRILPLGAIGPALAELCGRS